MTYIFIYILYYKWEVRISKIILSFLVTFCLSVSFHHLEKQTIIFIIFIAWRAVHFGFLLRRALFANDVSWRLIDKEFHSLLIHEDFVAGRNCSYDFLLLLLWYRLLYLLLNFLGFDVRLFLSYVFVFPFSSEQIQCNNSYSNSYASLFMVFVKTFRFLKSCLHLLTLIYLMSFLANKDAAFLYILTCRIPCSMKCIHNFLFCTHYCDMIGFW